MTVMTIPSLDASEAFKRWLESRGFVYQLFTDFFGRRPTLSLIAQWSSNWQIVAAAEMLEGGRELKRYLHDQNPHDLLKVCEREAAEYDRLMRGGGVIGLKPREAALLGEAEEFCNVIADVYASAGIVFKKCGDEADDHIAIELEFMAVLHDRMLYNSFSAQSAMEQLRTQESFLKEHLLIWAPEFCERLRSATDSPLYLGLSRMLEEFLPYDLHMLGSWKAALESTAAAM
ncbi:TorA maturation chaperone TorD [Paenibacillus forsythiae]|uniref:TorA maturation chaperone TorD n=1 Tax=Paenibacillus forsythiae TaxID=365616 RepID=A0ABU3H3Y9_9BACL|nr:molecular chaperone TorD family protein [Paenibacillus forsythiae]MDT3425534.1 TorA maturation chaperone TorD [Paenibacillus forsythiae]